MKIGGANAPPNSPTKPQKRGFGRVSAAWLWPGGHSRGMVHPGFAFWFYFQLDFSLQLWNCDKMAFDLWLQPLDLG